MIGTLTGGVVPVAMTGFTGIGCDYQGDGDRLNGNLGPFVIYADDHNGSSARADAEAWVAAELGL
jgi:hypothetical protein